jgi:hypothetical protein
MIEMNKQTANTVATILGVVGVLFILAMAFSIMPKNLALFLGIASFIIAGLVRTLAVKA